MKSRRGLIVPEELPAGPLRDALVKLRDELAKPGLSKTNPPSKPARESGSKTRGSA